MEVEFSFLGPHIFDTLPIKGQNLYPLNLNLSRIVTICTQQNTVDVRRGQKKKSSFGIVHYNTPA